MSEERQGFTVRIPADVSAPDKILFGATARQAIILGGAAGALWVAWLGMRSFIPPLIFAAPAFLFLLLLGIAVSAERDGVTCDRLLLAAIRQAFAPRRRVMAPEGVIGPPEFLRATLRGQDAALPAPLDLPVRRIGDDGLVRLGPDGTAVLAECSSVNFGLRTPAEQELLVGGFARWLNSLTGPVQITSRTTPADLSGQIDTLRTSAPDLPHPLLRASALSHADFLSEINESGVVLHRGQLITAHESDPQRSPQAVRRISDAAALLAACEIDASPLDSTRVHAVLSAALDPDPR